MDYIDYFPGREIILNHEKYLYFGGTSYLGVQTDAEFQEIYIKNIKKYGTNYGASRKSNVRFSIFEEAEAYLAKLTGSEACTTLSSGYLAGQFVCSYFGINQNSLFYAPNTHSALFQSKGKSYTTFTSLNIALREFLITHSDTTPVVFMDSIDFSGSNYPNFEGLKSLPLKDIILVVDDSHGIGVIGSKGGGVYNKLNTLQPKEFILCCSLGKSFGVQAGAVFGSKRVIHEMMATDFFGGASPTAPANLATIIDAENIYTQKRHKLAENIRLFKENLSTPDRFASMEHHPAYSFSDTRLASYLREKYMIVTNFGYPTEEAYLMSRIVLSASHKKEDVLQLTQVINSY